MRYLADKSTSNVNIIETGTAKGFSSICMAKALSDSNVGGKIVTFDIIPHDKKMYWNCIDDFDGPKSRAVLLEPWKSLIDKYVIFHQGDTRIEMGKVKLGRVNFAFLDGFHTYKDVMKEFVNFSSGQQKGDIIIFDDYTQDQYPGLVCAVDTICEKYSYQKRVLHSHEKRGYVVATKQ